MVAMVGEGESAETFEKEADVENEIDNDDDGDDVQEYEKEAVNSTQENEGSSADPTKTVVAVVAAEEEAASSMRTKRLGAYSCSLVARTQEAAAQKGMVGDDH